MALIPFVVGIGVGAYAAHRLRVEREIEREDAHLDRST